MKEASGPLGSVGGLGGGRQEGWCSIFHLNGRQRLKTARLVDQSDWTFADLARFPKDETLRRTTTCQQTLQISMYPLAHAAH